MFYYHNPLSFPSGAPRLPSLELPFSSTQPCKKVLMLMLKLELTPSSTQPCKIVLMLMLMLKLMLELPPSSTQPCKNVLVMFLPERYAGLPSQACL